MGVPSRNPVVALWAQRMAKCLQVKTRLASAGSRLPWVEQTDALPRTLAHVE